MSEVRQTIDALASSLHLPDRSSDTLQLIAKEVTMATGARFAPARFRRCLINIAALATVAAERVTVPVVAAETNDDDNFD